MDGHRAALVCGVDDVLFLPRVYADCRRMGSAAGAPSGGTKGVKAGPAWPELQQVAAHLYTVQGRHEEALQLQLQVGG